MSDRNYIDFSVYLNPLKVKDEAKSEGDVEALDYLDNNLIQETEYGLNTYNQQFYRYLGSTVTYEYSFEKDRSHKLTTYLDFSTYMHPFMEKQIDIEKYTDYELSKGFISKEFNEVFFESDISYVKEFSII